MSKPQPLMSVRDVATYMGRSTKWVYRNALELGGFKIGGPIMFRQADLDRWLETRRLSPTKAKQPA